MRVSIYFILFTLHLNNQLVKNMTTQKTTLLVILFILVIAFFVNPVAADTIAVNSGDSQTASVGTAVTVPPCVILTYTNSTPMSGVTVTFTIASGGGSLTGSTATTNSAGIATVGSWVLGSTAGTNTLTATSDSISGSSATFTATGTASAPTISGITPASGYNTSPVSITGLSGTGFSTSTNPTVVLRRSGSANITATVLTCTFDITGKPAGVWDVIVTNPDGQSATLTSGFTVNSNSAAATLTSITPSSGLTNTPVSITALAGTGFTGTPQVYLKRSNYNNIYSTVSTASSTSIAGTISLNNQAPGSYLVCVVNSGSDPVCGLSFTITTPATANGTNYFSTTPEGAVVYVDSVQKGSTPFTLYNVTPGSYAIKIQRASYLEWADRVTVTAGNQTTVSARLTAVDSSTTVTTAPPCRHHGNPSPDHGKIDKDRPDPLEGDRDNLVTGGVHGYHRRTGSNRSCAPQKVTR